MRDGEHLIFPRTQPDCTEQREREILLEVLLTRAALLFVRCCSIAANAWIQVLWRSGGTCPKA
jgi:hypothetical protein